MFSKSSIKGFKHLKPKGTEFVQLKDNRIFRIDKIADVSCMRSDLGYFENKARPFTMNIMYGKNLCSYQFYFETEKEMIETVNDWKKLNVEVNKTNLKF